MLKLPDILDAAASRKNALLENNPHERSSVRSSIGRIDYGQSTTASSTMCQGLGNEYQSHRHLPRDDTARQHLPAQEFFAERIWSAFQAIDSNGPAQPMVSIQNTQSDRNILQRIAWVSRYCILSRWGTLLRNS